MFFLIFREELPDERIMPRDDKLRFGSEPMQARKAPHHIFKINNDWEGLLFKYIFVVMRSVRCEAKPTRIRAYPNCLKPSRMPA